MNFVLLLAKPPVVADFCKNICLKHNENKTPIAFNDECSEYTNSIFIILTFQNYEKYYSIKFSKVEI